MVSSEYLNWEKGQNTNLKAIIPSKWSKQECQLKSKVIRRGKFQKYIVDHHLYLSPTIWTVQKMDWKQVQYPLNYHLTNFWQPELQLYHKDIRNKNLVINKIISSILVAEHLRITLIVTFKTCYDLYLSIFQNILCCNSYCTFNEMKFKIVLPPQNV